MWQQEPEFGTKRAGLLGVGVSWVVVTASTLVIIFRAQQRLLGMMPVIPKIGEL